MKLNIKENFDLTSNAQKYQIVLDTIAMMKGEDNFTETGIITIAMIAILQNACEEDVIELYESSEMSSIDFSKEIIEPKIKELLNDDYEYLYSIVNDVYDYKTRDIEMNGKMIYIVKNVLQELSKMDTQALTDIILSATALKETALKEVEVNNKVQQEEKVEEVNDKLQALVNKFTKIEDTEKSA